MIYGRITVESPRNTIINASYKKKIQTHKNLIGTRQYEMIVYINA